MIQACLKSPQGRGKKKEEKTAPTFSWDTEAQKENILSIMINLLELQLGRLWKGSLEEEFANIFSQVSFVLIWIL